MNQLRFRVWDQETSTMIPPSDVRLGFVFFKHRTDPKAFLYDSLTGDWKPIALSQIMRSTFRHDRSGKEIFEGDIIDTPRGRIVVRRRPEIFAAMRELAIPQPGSHLDQGMGAVAIGNFGPDRQRVLNRLLDESGMAGGLKSREQGGRADC